MTSYVEKDVNQTPNIYVSDISFIGKHFKTPKDTQIIGTGILRLCLEPISFSKVYITEGTTFVVLQTFRILINV